MEFSNEIIADFEDYKKTRKSGIILIFDSIGKTVEIDQVINRFQTLSFPQLAGSTKSVKGWASLNELEPNIVRRGIYKYGDDGYSSYALKEKENKLNEIRLPLVSSYTASTRLFSATKANEKCIGIMNAFARAYKFKIDYSKDIKGFCKVSNKTIYFSEVVRNDYSTYSLTDQEKMVKVIDLVCRVLADDEIKSLKIKSTNNDVVKHCASILSSLNFLASVNVGEDKAKLYSALSLQLCNGLALLGDVDLKNVALISNNIVNKLCEKFNITRKDYDYTSIVNGYEKYLERLKEEEIKRQPIVKKVDRTIKPITIKKGLDKIIVESLKKQLANLEKTYNTRKRGVDFNRIQQLYAYYEQIIADYVLSQDKQKSTIHKQGTDNFIAYSSAEKLIALRDGMLNDIMVNFVSKAKNVSGTVTLLNKYCNEKFKLTARNYIKEQVAILMENLPKREEEIIQAK